MPISPEQAFYNRHYGRVANEPVDVAAAHRAMQTSGDRYFCVLDRLHDPASLKAIEWGFGDLARTLVLNELFSEYTAVDISAEAIRRTGVDSVQLLEANLNHDLEVPNDHFDVTIAMMVVEHLFDPFHSFRELARVTKRGGLVFVNLPLVTALKNRVRLLMGQLPETSTPTWWDDREWDGGHLHYFTRNIVIQLGAMYGLRLDSTYPVGRFVNLKRLAPTLLCSELSFVFSKDR